MTGRSAICIAANWRYRERSSSCARSCSVPARRISSPSTQHHPAKPGPVFVVPINHYSDHRVALDVADALECWSSHALRLLVDGDVKGALRNRKTHRARRAEWPGYRPWQDARPVASTGTCVRGLIACDGPLQSRRYCTAWLGFATQESAFDPNVGRPAGCDSKPRSRSIR